MMKYPCKQILTITLSSIIWLLLISQASAEKEGWYITANGYRTEIQEADNEDYRLNQSCDPVLGCSFTITRQDYDSGFASDENIGLSIGFDYQGPGRTEVEIRDFDNSIDRRQFSDGSVDGGGNAELETTSLAFNFWYDFNHLGAVRPHLGLGLGFADVEFSGVDDEVIFGQLGAGVSWHFTDSLALTAGYRYALADDPEYESSRRLVVSEYASESYLIGLRYSFYNAAEVGGGDGDGDGTTDKYDRCPGTPRAVQVDARGCPQDSDGDGVADYLDSCADTGAGVKVDVVGCAVQ